MKRVCILSFVAAVVSTAVLFSCQKDAPTHFLPTKADHLFAAAVPNVGEIKLQEGVLYYPLDKVSHINANTAAIEVGNYNNLVYATQLTDAQKQGLGSTLTMNLNVYAGTAGTEPYGYLYYFKTAKGTAVPSGENDPILTSAYRGRRVEMARYILPYLATNWNDYGLRAITTTSPVVPYTFDISAFASALKDQDSTVWIASNQGQPAHRSYTYKVDLSLKNSGNTAVSDWKKDNYVLPIVGYLEMGNTTTQTKSVTRRFTVPEDISDVKFRIIYTGPEGFYTTNVVKLDNQQIDSYSTRMVCVPESRYQERNPSVANGAVQPGLWNYPTRNYCQSDTVPPHTTMLASKLTKGTHELTINMTQNRIVSDYGGEIKISISLIGTRSLGVSLFQHCNYGGWKVTLAPGNYTMAQLVAKGLVNDDTSSIKIPSGYTVTLYEGDNFSGKSLVLTADNTCLIDKVFNDNVSSVKVVKN
ncbi:MAG: Carbohydrate binding family 6 [Sphingobacterium sp.]|jgi:hypothetical protein|nr:Carbohydrate binding family 6 [Sphingobacterium sp.]